MSLESRVKAALALIAADVKALQGAAPGGGGELSLPSYAGARTKQYDPAKGAYNWKQSNTKRLRNSLRRAQFGTGPAHWVNISDSSSSGFIGGQSAAGYDVLGAWPLAMRDTLVRELGVQSGGTGIVPAGQWPLFDSDKMWPMGTRWVPSAVGSWVNNGGYSSSNGANTFVTFFSDQAGTQVDVWYSGLSGQFGVIIDGGAAVNPPRSGIAEVQKYTVTGLANTQHTVGIIDNLADGAAAHLFGINVSDPTKGLQIHNLGIYGEKTYIFDEATDVSLAAVNRQIMVDNLGANMVDVIFFKIGANDLTAGRTAAQVKTSIQNLKAKTRFANADVVLVAQALDPSTANGLAYLQMMYDLADQWDCPLVDTFALHGTAATALADGIITPLDNVHYNYRGQRQTGMEIAAPILDMVEARPSSESNFTPQAASLTVGPVPNFSPSAGNSYKWVQGVYHFKRAFKANQIIIQTGAAGTYYLKVDGQIIWQGYLTNTTNADTTVNLPQAYYFTPGGHYVEWGCASGDIYPLRGRDTARSDDTVIQAIPNDYFVKADGVSKSSTAGYEPAVRFVGQPGDWKF